MAVHGFTTDVYLRVSTLGLVLLVVLCLAGFVGVGWFANQLLRDRYGDVERGGSLTYAGVAILAAIVVGAAVLLVLNVDQESPSQAARQISSEARSQSGNPFLESESGSE